MTQQILIRRKEENFHCILYIEIKRKIRFVGATRQNDEGLKPQEGESKENTLNKATREQTQ